jgi:hypothetical protein
VRICILLDIFQVDYIGPFFFIFAQKFGSPTNPVLGNIHDIFFSKMLGKLLGNFGNFSLLGKVINVFFFIPSQKKLGILKILMLEIFWHYRNSYSAQ